ncbi:MAG: hypothetical protein C4532_06140 [Candidatus Abyssobacteria bacterium SURF_17]|uniref:Glycosyltransferase RgtA/B/C/D-like domain-containing protein n=1 Tax=Candidatus Abyssobacteria bacterium SURF_17 TaxID=2093361 RepID=A0A419F1Z6_9BACT|nr:MAG: hypothetical protein C4532_06140 [Candidatus Abyssubacteria bacterium SURF_17]
MYLQQNSLLKRFTRLIIEKHYLVLATVFFLLMLSNTLNSVRGTDFWEHSACVRELATHPSNPRHPQLLVDAPHVFFSPYLVLVGLFSRLTGLHAITSLSIFALLNVILLLIAIRLFALTLSDNPKVPTVFLLLLLFMWGWHPWDWSGFFHFTALTYTLSYPSTFAMSLGLLSLWMAASFFKTPSILWFSAIAACSAIVLLTHPTTAIFLWVGLYALAVSRFCKERAGVFFCVLAIPAISLIIGFFWPYYPLLDLIATENQAIEISRYGTLNYGLYQHIVERTFPAWIGLPVLWARFKKNRRDSLCLMFVALLFIYALGWVIRHPASLGRVISFVMIVLQAGTAVFVSQLLAQRAITSGSLGIKVTAALVSAVLTVLLIANNVSALSRLVPGRKSDTRTMQFLESHVGQYDVVCSDINTSWFVPTFGGKIIATLHPTYFVPDIEQRRNDLSRFFEDDASLEERVEIIKKYGAKYVLINKGRHNNSLLSEDAKIGRRVIYNSSDFVLLRLSGSRP